MKYQITPDLIAAGTKRRPGIPASGIRFLVAHDTGNAGSSARANVTHYKRTANEKSASAHLFVDDREIIECVPALTQTAEKAWHVRYAVARDNQLFGVDANDAAIGVEYCYGNNIDADQAYDRYVWVLAHLCVKFSLDPRRSIVGHFMLDPMRRTDPVSGLAASRRTYEQLLRDVPDEYARIADRGDGEGIAAPVPQNATARVRVNVRQGAPTRRAPVRHTLNVGALINIVRSVRGEPVNGNDDWYEIANGQFVWGGAFQ